MAEEKEPLDNSRLGKSKRKLVRLQNELNEQIEKMFEHQRKTNGQPMNDILGLGNKSESKIKCIV